MKDESDYRNALSGEVDNFGFSAGVLEDMVAQQSDHTPALPASVRRGLEERADTYSLEGLQSERRALIAKLKPLEFLFGSGGDREAATRRRHRDGIATLIARELEEAYLDAPLTAERVLRKDFKPPSEAALERMANDDPRHVAFCQTIEDEFDTWYTLKNELADIQEQIETRPVEIRAYTAEIGLSR